MSNKEQGISNDEGIENVQFSMLNVQYSFEERENEELIKVFHSSHFFSKKMTHAQSRLSYLNIEN